MSNWLTRIICTEIARRGPLPFREYMELALYHPAYGYYTSGRAQIGRKGDFFTNVSVGPLFGRLLAMEFARLWEAGGRPADFALVEQGAHGGELMGDVLGGLRELAPECLAASRAVIVEPSDVLAERQQQHLASLPVEWMASLDELEPFAGVHFSNELPDAFPVHLVTWTGTGWRERGVDVREDRLAFVDLPLSSMALAEACAAIPQPLPAGYVTEVNLIAPRWLGSIAAKLTRGSVLLVDYGYTREEYYAPERIEGTLSAYAHHRREPDLLAQPGEVDLTAHVNFTSLIEAGERAGLRLAEFTDQHHFIAHLGMDYFAEGTHAKERRAFMTLMHPQFMGQAFKVLRMERNA
jgi:SAM-dependent MidA family methyltransferase